MTTAKISITNAHGRFSATPAALDRAIGRYLPASVEELRREVQEVCGWDASDIGSASELLLALADAFGEYTAADAEFDESMASCAASRAQEASAPTPWPGMDEELNPFGVTEAEWNATNAYAASRGTEEEQAERAARFVHANLCGDPAAL